ncbi:hypothetical protein LBMAG56_37500 [Verrucomicrobiota bacterium]|nr:hypothetical protein LBMAG56_37500 [Verrucomicrobiota bacterium]
MTEEKAVFRRVYRGPTVVSPWWLWRSEETETADRPATYRSEKTPHRPAALRLIFTRFVSEVRRLRHGGKTRSIGILFHSEIVAGIVPTAR